MLQGSDPITKKITKKTSTKHHPGDRFQDVTGGEVINGAFKKSLVLSHESPIRKRLLPCLSSWTTTVSQPDVRRSLRETGGSHEVSSL